MTFCIINVADLDAHGVNHQEFRKSEDGSKAIVHEDYLLPVVDTSDLESYEFDSVELQELLQQPEWALKEY